MKLQREIDYVKEEVISSKEETTGKEAAIVTARQEYAAEWVASMDANREVDGDIEFPWDEELLDTTPMAERTRVPFSRIKRSLDPLDKQEGSSRGIAAFARN